MLTTARILAADDGLGATRKRPRDGDPPAPLAFSIQPCKGSLVHAPFLVLPQTLVHRAKLPLYFINSCRSTGTTPSGLFRANAQALAQLNPADATIQGPFVLVCRVNGFSSLFALEKIEDGLFSIVVLADWVTLQHISALPFARVSAKFEPGHCSNASTGLQEWWTDASVARPSKKARLEQQPSEPQVESATNLPEPALLDDSAGLLVVNNDPDANLEEQQAPEAAIKALIVQYLEALYLSKASHAYFAKAPVARVRAAFKSSVTQKDKGRDKEFALELIDALRAMVLSLVVLDRKYRVKIPEFVKSLSLQSPEQSKSVSRGRSSRPKKLKRTKPNKEGLYSLEEDYLKQWWTAEEDANTVAVASDAQISSSISELRTRETLLQIVLILEVLALEKALERAERQEFLDADYHEHATPGKEKRSAKKLVDLETILDVLVDRLCIQQSIEHEAAKKESEKVEEEDQESNLDQVKDFCLAVAIPFYGGRIPKLVESLSVRFGVKDLSPSKAKTSKSKKHQAQAPKPGTEIKRDLPATEKSQRCAAADRSSKVPSLLRSATEPKLGLLHDRSRSSTPQLPSFKADGRRPLSRASSISQASRPLQREVDLGAIARKVPSKPSSGKSNIEQELKNAIATLKKPNRSMAVKEYIDAVDERKKHSKGRAITRPGSHLSRSLSAVQVDATPSKPTRHSFGLGAPLQGQAASPEPEAIQSTDPVIPSSTAKGPLSLPRNSTLSRYAHVDQTPSRRSSKRSLIFSGPDEDSDSDIDGFVPTSVSQPSPFDAGFKLPPLPQLDERGSASRLRDSGVGLSPVFGRGKAVEEVESLERTDTGITATPTKARQPPAILQAGHPDLSATPVKAPKGPDASLSGQSPGLPQGKSVYDALGWNDDDELA